MGLLDRILGRSGTGEEAVVKGPVSLDPSSAEERINEVVEAKKAEVRQRSAEPVLEILRQKEIARGIVEDLRDLEIDDDIKERTYKPILTSKPVYVKGMLEGLKGIRARVPEGFEELEGFYDGCTKALKSIQAVQQKKGRYMSFAFRNEMLRLGSALNRIIDAIGELEESLSELNAFLEGAEEVRSNLRRLDDMILNLQRENREKGRTEAKLKALEGKIKAKEDEIQALDGSEEFLRHREMKEELKRLGREKSGLEATIHSLISPLQRPLRKYEKSLESAGGKTQKNFLEAIRDYQRSPKEAFSKEGPGDMVITRVLTGLKEAVLTGGIDMNERERKKTLSRISAVDPAKTRDAVAELIRIGERKAQISKWLSGSKIIERREGLMRERDQLLRELEDARALSSRRTPNLEELEEQKGEAEKGLERLVGSKVELLLHEVDFNERGKEDL